MVGRCIRFAFNGVGLLVDAGILRLLIGISTRSLAHVYSDQACHQDREVELTGDTLGHGRIAGLQGHRRDIAEPLRNLKQTFR